MTEHALVAFAAKKAVPAFAGLSLAAAALPDQILTYIVGITAPLLSYRAARATIRSQARRNEADSDAAAAAADVSAVSASSDAVALMRTVMDEALEQRQATIDGLRADVRRLTEETAQLNEIVRSAVDQGFNPGPGWRDSD